MKFGKILGKKRFTTEGGTKVRLIPLDEVDIAKSEDKPLCYKRKMEATFIKVGNEFKIIDKHESTD